MCYNVYIKERKEVITMKNPHGMARELLIDEMLRKLEEEEEKDAKKAS